jgi:hypothetical protein
MAAWKSWGKRTVTMSDFYVPPEKSLINETVVQPGEIITAVLWKQSAAQFGRKPRSMSDSAICRQVRNLAYCLAVCCVASVDYRGWPRCRLNSPRAERMRVNIPITPST